AWSTAGTGFGVNSPSGFAGNVIDIQRNGVSALSIDQYGVTYGLRFASDTFVANGGTLGLFGSSGGILNNAAVYLSSWSNGDITFTSGSSRGVETNFNFHPTSGNGDFAA